MDELVCPVDVTHHLYPTTREQPDAFGKDAVWYDCRECGLSFATNVAWPDDFGHPRWYGDDPQEEE